MRLRRCSWRLRSAHRDAQTAFSPCATNSAGHDKVFRTKSRSGGFPARITGHRGVLGHTRITGGRNFEIAIEVASMQGHCPSSPTSTPLQPPGWAGKKANVRERVLPLTDLALETLAQNPGSIHDLRWTAEHLAIALLERLFARGKLDYRLACVFRDSGHQPIREAIEGLDLLAVCAWPASGPPQERRSS